MDGAPVSLKVITAQAAKKNRVHVHKFEIKAGHLQIKDKREKQIRMTGGVA